jgi:hypothetical protein
MQIMDGILKLRYNGGDKKNSFSTVRIYKGGYIGGMWKDFYSG